MRSGLSKDMDKAVLTEETLNRIQKLTANMHEKAVYFGCSILSFNEFGVMAGCIIEYEFKV